MDSISSYKIIKENLYLLIDNSYLSSYYVLTSELSKEQFSELYNFVKNKLPEAK